MFLKKPKRSWGFHGRRLGSALNAIIPERVIYHHRAKHSGVKGAPLRRINDNVKKLSLPAVPLRGPEAEVHHINNRNSGVNRIDSYLFLQI